MICLGLKVLLKCDSTEPRSSQNAEAAPSSEEARPGLAPEPLLQDAPIPGDDDKESEQPTIAADNTITQPPMHDVQSLSPNFPGVSFAERRRQQERQETSCLRTPLWPLARDHPDPESPGKPKPARHHESVNIVVELFRKMAAKAQPTFRPGGTMIRKPMRFTLGPQQVFGASKMDFWLVHISDFPLPADELQTPNGLTMRRNSRIILVNEEQPAPVGDEPWFGKILYPLTKDAAAEFGQTYVGDVTKKFNNKTIPEAEATFGLPKLRPRRRTSRTQLT